MSVWIVISWVVVIVLTAVNIFVFLKLKKTSDQMMKMAFPGAKNMQEGLAQMQKMMQGRGNPFAGGGRNNAAMEGQLRTAMDMLSKMQKGGK